MFPNTILDRSKLEAAYITFSTMFDMTLARVPTMFQDLVTIIPTSTEIVDFKWLGDVPGMEEWVGQRAISKLRAEGHRVRSKDWANGLEIGRDDLEDDKLGLIAPRIESIGEEGMWAMEKLTFDFLNGGFAATLGTCYDSQYLIDSDHHASGSGEGAAQSNLISGALSATTYDLAETSLASRLDAKGQPITVIPDSLIVGNANRRTARKLLKQKTLASGEDNIDAGTANLFVSPRVSSTKWWLASNNRSVRALIMLLRQAPRFNAVTDMDQYFSFMNKNFLFGADARFGLGYGLWQTIAGSLGA